MQIKARIQDRNGGITMSKKFYEFDSELELNRHLKYWSNACGEFQPRDNRRQIQEADRLSRF